MSQEENKNQNEAGTEQTVVLTAAELADVRKVIAQSAEKDAKIADLTGLIGELRKQVSEVANIDPAISNLEVQAVQTGKYCKMRKHDDKWILGWTAKGVYRERNTLNEIVEYMDIVVQGVKEPVKMALLTLVNDCPQSVVEIKERRPLPDHVKDEGLVPAMSFDEKTGQHEYSNRKVRSKVVSQASELVLLLDGEEVVIHEKYVNQ